MKYVLIVLILFCSFFAQAQDEYFRTVDWKFIPDSVVIVAQDTYLFKATPTDFNDPGAVERTVGNYVVDFSGRRYLVIDSTSTTITVFDEFRTGYAPQTFQIARCYKSVGDGDAAYVGSVDYFPLDATARWKLNGADNELLWRQLAQPFDSVQFDTTVGPLPVTPYTMYADTTDRTISVNLGNGVVMQINQETLIEVYNATSDTIFNGKVCFGTGISNDIVSVSLASKTGRYAALLMSTEDILPSMKGLGVSLVGKVRGLNTGSLTLGPVYLDTLGNLTNTTPQFPDYSYLVGVVVKTGVTDGIIQFKSDGVNFYNSTRNILDGSIRETFDFRTFSDGVDIYGVLTNPTGADKLTLVFSTGWFDLAVPDTILMTAGAIKGAGVDPQMNYVYIPEGTKALTVATGGFPTTEFAQISKAALFDAVSTQTDGAIRNQNINNHFKTDNDNGHIVHMGDRIRVLDAAWESGVAPTLVGTPSNVYFQTTGGKVWQMHLQNFEAQDMTTGDDIHVVNDPITAYRTTTNLNDITAFSDGSAWNNEWSNLVLWGVCNKSGEVSHIMVNLPSDGYQQEESAIADALNYSNYTIPREFRGVGFLIGRFTVRRSGGNFTYNSATGFLDLRGFVPNTTAGGGAGGGAAITEWTQLNDIPNSYVGFGDAIVTIASAETGAEFTPRASINLSDFNNDLPSELQTISTTGAAGNITLSGGGGTLNLNVNDADSDPTNEYNTISGAYDYITLSGQDIVRGQVDYNTDVSNKPTSLPTSSTWQDVIDNGTATVTNSIKTGGLLSLGNVTIGNGTGSPFLTLNKSGSVQAAIEFNNGATNQSFIRLTGSETFQIGTTLSESIEFLTNNTSRGSILTTGVFSWNDNVSASTAPTLDAHLTNKFYVDNLPVSTFTNDAGYITSDSYISNVTESLNSISFTGVVSAFNGSVGSIAKTDIAQVFSASASSMFLLDMGNTSTGGFGLRVKSSNTILELDDRDNNDRFRFSASGAANMFNLSSGTKANVVYIDPSTKELFEGEAPSGTVSFGLENQIPVTNSTTDDFDYSSGLTYTGSIFTVTGQAKVSNGVYTDAIFSLTDNVQVAVPDQYGMIFTRNIRLAGQTGDISPSVSGDIWYNSTSQKFRLKENNKILDITNASGFEESSDPSTLIGGYVIWQSNGTGSGDDGDIMIKINDGSTTKTITLVDFSAF